MKAAVLISGGGSNLKALIDAIGSGRLDLEIVLVVSNREDAGGVDYARAADIPVSIVSHTAFEERQKHDAAVAEVLLGAEPQLIILAGYMRILGDDFTRRFHGRLINLHPSLLPLHKGLDTYRRVLRAGDSEYGASIHFVNAGLDAGPVISQITLAVLADDDANSLKSRLGPLEHRLLVATVDLFCRHEIRYENEQIIYKKQVLTQALQLNQKGTLTV